MSKAPSNLRLLSVAILVCLVGLPQLDAAAAQETVKVGIVLPLTGSQAFFGEMESQSFELALEEINLAGGVRGRPLEFVFADDEGRPEVGAAAAERLIDEEGVVLLGGGYSSAVTLKVAEVAQGRGMPFLVNTGAADAITQRGWDHVFRMNPPSSQYVASAVSFLREVVKPRTAAIIHEESAFGQSQSEAFEAACRELGIPIVVHESYAAPAGRSGATATDDFKLWHFTEALSKVKRVKPDVVYLVAYLLDANMLMTQASVLGWSPKAWIGGGAGFTLPKFYELAREAADNVFTVTLWDRSLPYPGADAYFTKFEARYGRQPDYHGAEAYAAAYVIADALGRADSLEPAAIRHALAATRLDTAFGPVDFVSDDLMTNQNRLDTYLGQWLDGRLQLVWPQDVARAKYVYPIP